jgi:putative ABC transport system permease protein
MGGMSKERRESGVVRAGQNLLESFKSAFIALRVNKMRSSLTMLGIVIGVGTVIMLISLSLGAKNNINKGIDDIGNNIVIVMSGKIDLTGGLGAKPSERKGGSFVQSNRMRPELNDAIQKELPPGFYSAPVMVDTKPVKYRDKSYFTQFVGTNENYPIVRGQGVAEGEFFKHSERSRSVCVLGSTAAKAIFGEADPLGQEVTVGAHKLKVIGVLEEKGRSFLIDNDDIVLIPSTIMQRYYGKSTADYFLVSSPNADQVNEAKDIAVGVLSKELGSDEFTAIPQSEMLGFAGSISRIMTYLVVAIASISLLVGGIGIMNIMLVSVTERTHEIGLRKAVGAKPRHILSQFITEAVVLSFTGGAVGIVFAYFGASGLSKILHIPSETATWAIMLAFFVSVGIGLFFGVFPAWKAAKMEPIEALRTE